MIQVYTGNGKGKTTAALGLALRAAGCGLKVYIAQFLKGRDYGELNTLKKIKNIKLEQFGAACFIKRVPQKKDIQLAEAGLAKVKKVLLKKSFDMVILDEINIALKLGLLKTERVVRLLKEAPGDVELILTGRCAPVQILKIADLITEMKEAKHYFSRGVKARRGIEL